MLDYVPPGIYRVRLERQHVRIIMKPDDLRKDPRSFTMKALADSAIFRIPGITGIKTVYLSGGPVYGFDRESGRMLELLRQNGYELVGDEPLRPDIHPG